ARCERPRRRYPAPQRAVAQRPGAEGAKSGKLARSALYTAPPMPDFESFDGTSLFYDEQGDGRAVVLLHGFAADTNINFVRPGIFDRLLDLGYRVIALDARGHGLSGKPHDPEAYRDEAMANDVRALLDHLALDRCAL